MHWRTLLLVAAAIWPPASSFAANTAGAGEKQLNNATSIHASTANRTVLLGQPCMTVEHFRPVPNDNSSFFECSPLTEEERADFDLGGKYLGVWRKRGCAKDHAFDVARQRCADKKKLHRQRAQCAAVGAATPACRTFCEPAAWTTPLAGGVCNWQYSLLYYAPEDNRGFLQCAQTSLADPCGEWVRIDCPPQTMFDLGVQLCVPLSAQLGEDPNRVCSAPNQVAVCKCGRRSSACPGISECTSGVCCATISPYDLIPVEQPALVQASPGVCVGSGTYPVASCTMAACPPSYSCQPSVGCCPAILSILQPVTTTVAVPTPKTMVLQLATCPISNTPPISSCGSCPSGYICAPLLGACCPAAPAPPPTSAPTSVVTPLKIYLCPSGQMPTQTCSSTRSCPPGSTCSQGACCPCSCAPPQMMIGICASGISGAASCAASGGQCSNGCCCAEPPKMPVCSNGVVASYPCMSAAQCSRGQECSNGGCCSIPYCPTGQQAVGRCGLGQTCGGGGGTVCLEGLCCQMPTCSSGAPATTICTSVSQCPAGTSCQNGGCCAVPMCPGGAPAQSTCSTSCSPQPFIISIPVQPTLPPMPTPRPVCCSAGQQCVSGGCCPLPTCASSGQLAVSFCAPTAPVCPSGTECSGGGGCCPLPLCPSGAQALQRCSGTAPCPGGTTCTGGLCCTLPVCLYGGNVASSFCGSANACPGGFYCETGACCPEPVPLCPSGGRSVQACVRGSDCPSGYGCTANGGCCQLVTDFICPLNASPVCQCSPTLSCPTGTSCNSGICCTTGPAYYSAVPGTACDMPTQCAGYGNGASCSNNVCICINGAYSNGVACDAVPDLTIEIARAGCDQYGSPCRYMLSSARRRPVLSPTKNATDVPLWYNTVSATIRRCPRAAPDNHTTPDHTCLPNEKCIDGICKTRLWPGEYGCETDAECSSRCPKTYCEYKTDNHVPQCQCIDGMLLYGRCFDKCPKGFHESGARCEHDDEDAFWVNAEAQHQLQKLLNAGSC